MFKALLFSTLLILLFSSCQNLNDNFETILPSPDSKKHLYFNLNEGEPYYLLYFEDHIFVDWSMLGFIMDDTIKFNEGLVVNNVVTSTSTQAKEGLFPGVKANLDSFNEMKITLTKENTPDIQLLVVMRIYDNAVAFKYKFNFTGDKRAIKETTELDFYANLFEKIDTTHTILQNDSIVELSVDDVDTLFLPATFISNESHTLEYLESISQDYPAMKLLKRTPGKAEFQMKYADDSVEKISVKAGFETPWRIIYISDNNN